MGNNFTIYLGPQIGEETKNKKIEEKTLRGVRVYYVTHTEKKSMRTENSQI